MSPAAAVQSDVFRLYFYIVAAFLVLAALALAVATWGLKRDVRSVWTTYRSWLVMSAVLIGAIFAGRVATILLFTLLAIFGLKEFARATGLYRDWWMTGAVYLAIISVGMTTLVPDPNNGRPGWYGLFMTVPVFGIAGLLLIPIVRNQPAGQLQAVSLAILGFIYIGWMFGHLGFLANSEYAYGYLLYLIFAVALNDVAAFIFGKLFGRHQLRSNISPNKTWEGAWGGLIVSLVLPWLLWFSFPHFGPLQLVLAGLIIGIGGQLGDLSLGFIKRDLGIKDSGALIPGHGGILDRINSLIYTSPLFLHMVDYFYKHF